MTQTICAYVIEIYARTLHRIKGLIANYNCYFHAFSATASRQLTRRVAYFVCADINRRDYLRHGNMSYVHSGSVLFPKQRVLCAEHAQTKSAPKPLQNTLHEKGALGGKLRESGARAGWKSLAVVPKINLERYGRRAFSCAGPTLWNALPLNLRTQQDPARFRRDLKTYLFNVAYSKYFFF